MVANNSILPTWEFVGGETRQRQFEVYTDNHAHDLPGAVCNLSVAPYGFDTAPVINKQFQLEKTPNGVTNTVLINLLPEETVGLHGRYTYQLTIRDKFGNFSIPQQGTMYITKNINSAFITD